MRLWVWISAGFVVLWSVVIVVQFAATGTVSILYAVLWTVSVLLLFLDNHRAKAPRRTSGAGHQGHQGHQRHRVAVRSDRP